MNLTSSVGNTCTNCGKHVQGGTYIQGVFYCPFCTSIINKNNSQQRTINNIENVPDRDLMMPDCCKGCCNHPCNGGNGICYCTIPHMYGKGPICSVKGGIYFSTT